jgi:Nucleotide-diphospho-sugar transferase
VSSLAALYSFPFVAKQRFAEHSKESAKAFRDKSFRMMVIAKIRYAQMVSMLGFNFLFQDVDVVWYKLPMQYFMDTNGKDSFDFFFQEDGTRTMDVEPYDANSGFYFAWNNERTRHFFNSMLMSMDATLATSNDQIVFNVMLSEHAVRHGLKVKTLPRFEMEFPGGFNFHDASPAGKDRMKKVLDETGKAYIFHMSWTASAADKDLYLQQLGMWYVQEQCVHQPADKLLIDKPTPVEISAKCCSPEPLYRCHYRDKPSIGPCHDSPFKDTRAKVPWW